ncbi:MAG TPA: cupredoxin domain-containing protein [Trichocoleus sp.]
MSKNPLLNTALAAMATGALLSLLPGGSQAMDHSMPPEAMDHSMPPEATDSGFQPIEQPLPIKLAVTAGGLGLMGLELWWFLFSRPQARRAHLAGGLQEVTITVDGGYDPDQVEVEAGKPVRLNFVRKDPSSCLETLILPDFRRSVDLTLDNTTTIDLPAPSPGEYPFHCGMNMYRGTLTVR